LRTISLRLAAATVCCALLCPGVRAETPKTIKVIVPSTPGGGADILARLLGEQISRTQGVTMVVENRPGAGNTIGTEAASRAAPDGGTLLINTPEFVINAHLRKLSYDPLTGFEPICYLVRSPQVIVVNGESPYRTLVELGAAAKAKPGELTLASTGPASSPHITFETLKRSGGLDMTYVPYPGSGPAVNALLGGHVTAVFASYPNVAEQVAAGKLRALVTAARERLPEIPGVPTLAEAGFKDIEADIWFGVVAPAKMPADTTAELARWFTAALDVPDIKAKLAVQGMLPVGTCGAAFGAFIRKQHEDYGRAIRDANIKVQ
jgi:tripartite-type tricarboxylate transporter receptor subunit TctC